MKFPNRTPIAAAVIALCGALPVGAQAASVTIEAESMSLSSYVVENGTRIKVASNATSGTATKSFSGTTGTYDIQVQVATESDGQPTLDVYKGSTLLKSFTYPLANGTSTTFTVPGVSIASGETIKLVGRKQGDAWARVDKIVFNSTTTTSPSSGVSFKAPTAGATLSGTVSSTKCEAAGTGISKVQFYLDSTALNTELSSPYNCSLDTTKFANGSHVLKAVATFTDGRTGSAQVSVNIQNSTASTPSTTTACANPSGGYEGFGRNTTGGAGKTVYRVTNLNDSGSGSLRDALSQGNRCVVFDVGGTISLSSNVLVRGANVTIDGLTAPSPGITLKNRTLVMQGSSGAGNVVVRGIRHRAAPLGEDAIRIYNAANVVIDRVSVSGFGDGAIDVTENARDVTIQYSILGNGNPDHNFPSLVGYDATRITLHHNLYHNGDNRNPYCGRNSSGSASNGWSGTTLAPEIVCDVRNNLIWNYATHGTAVRAYGTANVVNNYYYTKESMTASRTIYIAEGGVAYTSGNYSKNGWNVNGNGNRSTPYSAISPTTTDALTAARDVLAKAGARGPRFGLDSADQNYIGQISLQ